MGKLIIFIAALFLETSLQAQSYDSWNVYHNRKEISKFNNKKEPKDERKVLAIAGSLNERLGYAAT